MFRLKPAVVLSLLSLVPSSIQQAQNFLPAAASSSFPQCAYACTLLEQAQTICLPPSALVTSQSIYNTCFCQSGLLQPFYSTPNGVCDQFCPNPADLVTLQNWYKGFCAAQNQANQPTTSTTTVAPSTSSVSTSAITAIATSNTGSGSTSSQNTSNSQSQSWCVYFWVSRLSLPFSLASLPLRMLEANEIQVLIPLALGPHAYPPNHPSPRARLLGNLPETPFRSKTRGRPARTQRRPTPNRNI